MSSFRRIYARLSVCHTRIYPCVTRGFPLKGFLTFPFSFFRFSRSLSFVPLSTPKFLTAPCSFLIDSLFVFFSRIHELTRDLRFFFLHDVGALTIGRPIGPKIPGRISGTFHGQMVQSSSSVEDDNCSLGIFQ